MRLGSGRGMKRRERPSCGTGHWLAERGRARFETQVRRCGHRSVVGEWCHSELADGRWTCGRRRALERPLRWSHLLSIHSQAPPNQRPSGPCATRPLKHRTQPARWRRPRRRPVVGSQLACRSHIPARPETPGCAGPLSCPVAGRARGQTTAHARERPLRTREHEQLRIQRASLCREASAEAELADDFMHSCSREPHLSRPEA